MDGILLQNIWEESFAAFKQKPTVSAQRTCEAVAIAICDTAMNSKPSPRRLLEIAMGHLGISPDAGPEPGPDHEVAIEHLVHAAWTRIEDDDYQVIHTQGEPLYAYSINRDFRMVRVSDAWARKLGYEPNELLGRQSTDFLTNESREKAINKYLPMFFEQGWIQNAEYDAVTKGGQIIPISLSATSETDENGKVLKSFAVITLR